jgi:integrase
MQKTLLDDVSIVPSKSSSFQAGDIRAFPFKLYDELLELAKPRERLIYLLCGACSARANQALNLTFYDIDYSSKNIWLIDPRSNDQLGYHGISRKHFLKDEYNINIEEDKKHNKFGFKYPIPTLFKSRMPLMWLNENYKEIFFNTLAEYDPLPESLRIPRHPFVFVRSTGKRLSYDEVIKSFKKHLAILAKKYPELKYRLEGLGMHSLRHMFGSVMATVEGKMIQAGLPNIGYVRWFTKVAMGHSLNGNSTDIYFNRPWEDEVKLGEFFQAQVKLTNEQEYIELSKRGNYGKKW